MAAPTQAREVRTTVILSRPLHYAWKLYCVQQNTTMSAHIRSLLRDALHVTDDEAP